MTHLGGRVLVVDDDPAIRTAVRDVLDEAGFLVLEAGDGTTARELAIEQDLDVVLLDLGLPDIGGLDVLVDLTRSQSVPVIIVSGRSGETDRVVGLDLGADDYISKPFSRRELVARVRAAVRRRARDQGPQVMGFGELVIDEATRDVTVGDTLVSLTAKEFDLLAFLARSPRQVFNRAQLLEHVWGSSPQWQHENTVAEHIYRIRRKLDPDDRSRWIETVRGVGYRFAPQGADRPDLRAITGR